MKHVNNWCLAVMISGAVMLSATGATAAVYSCERYSAEPSGFGSIDVFDSWFPETITLNSNEGEKDGNQLVFKTTYQMSGGKNYVVHTTRLLPNGKAVAGLSNVGGFRQSGQARYKCRNLNQE